MPWPLTGLVSLLDQHTKRRKSEEEDDEEQPAASADKKAPVRRFPNPRHREGRDATAEASTSGRGSGGRTTLTSKKLQPGELLVEGQIVVEVTRDKERVYQQVDGRGALGGPSAARLHVVERDVIPRDPLEQFARRYLLPEGFPESVAPQYAEYMGWRGVQYFFGGAISVFTTKSLISVSTDCGKWGHEGKLGP